MLTNKTKNSLIPFLSGALLATGLMVGSASGFDVRSSFAPDTPSTDIFKFGFEAYKDGRKEEAVEALKYAAEKGHPGSLWKLGRMYFSGDGVDRDPREAFRLFGQVADKHADVRPGTKTASFVASSFVALGRFHENGSEEAGVRKNRSQARRYYEHAAFYFGDADAQFELARFLLDVEKLNSRRVRQASRILFSAAQKGHPRAAARLGTMLVEGKFLKRDLVQGLKFLTIALQRANNLQRPDIQPLQERAFSMATDNQRRRAMDLAQAEIFQ